MGPQNNVRGTFMTSAWTPTPALPTSLYPVVDAPSLNQQHRRKDRRQRARRPHEIADGPKRAWKGWIGRRSGKECCGSLDWGLGLWGGQTYSCKFSLVRRTTTYLRMLTLALVRCGRRWSEARVGTDGLTDDGRNRMRAEVRGAGTNRVAM
jgi:hypothetical protein